MKSFQLQSNAVSFSFEKCALYWKKKSVPIRICLSFNLSTQRTRVLNVHSGRCNLREKLKSGGLFFPLDDGLVIDRIRVINVTTDRRRKLFSKLDTYLSSSNRSERSNSSVIQMIRYGCTNDYRVFESEM